MENDRKPTTVFAVSSGCYSDYHIEAIFSSRENAQEYIDKLNLTGTDDGYRRERDIETYPLDELAPNGRTFWQGSIKLNGDDGTAAPAEDVTYYDLERLCVFTGATLPFATGVVLAHDEQHAIKVLNERRTAWILSNNWTEGAS